MFEDLVKQQQAQQKLRISEIKTAFDASAAKSKGAVTKHPFHLNQVVSWGIPGRLDMSGTGIPSPLLLPVLFS